MRFEIQKFMQNDIQFLQVIFISFVLCAKSIKGATIENCPPNHKGSMRLGISKLNSTHATFYWELGVYSIPPILELNINNKTYINVTMSLSTEQPVEDGVNTAVLKVTDTQHPRITNMLVFTPKEFYNHKKIEISKYYISEANELHVEWNELQDHPVCYYNVAFVNMVTGLVEIKEIKPTTQDIPLCFFQDTQYFFQIEAMVYGGVGITSDPKPFHTRNDQLKGPTQLRLSKTDENLYEIDWTPRLQNTQETSLIDFTRLNVFSQNGALAVDVPVTAPPYNIYNIISSGKFYKAMIVSYYEQKKECSIKVMSNVMQLMLHKKPSQLPQVESLTFNEDKSIIVQWSDPLDKGHECKEYLVCYRLYHHDGECVSPKKNSENVALIENILEFRLYLVYVQCQPNGAMSAEKFIFAVHSLTLRWENRRINWNIIGTPAEVADLIIVITQIDSKEIIAPMKVLSEENKSFKIKDKSVQPDLKKGKYIAWATLKFNKDMQREQIFSGQISFEL